MSMSAKSRSKSGRFKDYRLITELHSTPTSRIFSGERYASSEVGEAREGGEAREASEATVSGDAKNSTRNSRPEQLEQNEKTVVIKWFYGVSLLVQQERKSFLREVHSLQQLQHPAILPLLSAGFRENTPYLVMKYASGGSLAKRMQAPLTYAEVVRTLDQIGQALHYAHQWNIVHGNLKPQNILFTASGDAMLSDFCLKSISLASTTTLSSPETQVYTAPEQLVGKASPQSDLYALGCIAYEMLTGRKPFLTPSATKQGVYYKTKTLIAPRMLNSVLSPYIEAILLKALAREPEQRYMDIPTFLAALDAYPSGQVEDGGEKGEPEEDVVLTPTTEMVHETTLSSDETTPLEIPFPVAHVVSGTHIVSAPLSTPIPAILSISLPIAVEHIKLTFERVRQQVQPYSSSVLRHIYAGFLIGRQRFHIFLPVVYLTGSKIVRDYLRPPISRCFSLVAPVVSLCWQQILQSELTARIVKSVPAEKLLAWLGNASSMLASEVLKLRNASSVLADEVLKLGNARGLISAESLLFLKKRWLWLLASGVAIVSISGIMTFALMLNYSPHRQIAPASGGSVVASPFAVVTQPPVLVVPAHSSNDMKTIRAVSLSLPTPPVISATPLTVTPTPQPALVPVSSPENIPSSSAISAATIQSSSSSKAHAKPGKAKH